jgi:hypothetical protein
MYLRPQDKHCIQPAQADTVASKLTLPRLTRPRAFCWNSQYWHQCRDVSVMGDMGNQPDRKAGFGSTDGQWHHIAVTWESSTGIATLYLDGRKVRSETCSGQGPCLYPEPSQDPGYVQGP